MAGAGQAAAGGGANCGEGGALAAVTEEAWAIYKEQTWELQKCKSWGQRTFSLVPPQRKEPDVLTRQTGRDAFALVTPRYNSINPDSVALSL